VGRSREPSGATGLGVTAFLPWYHVQLQRSAYTSLRDGHGLTLVENEELRTAIIRYFERDQVSLLQLIDRPFTEREVLFDLLWPHIMWGEPGDGALSMAGILRATLVSPWSEVIRDVRIFNQLASVRGTAAVSVRGAGAAYLANAGLRRLIERESSEF